MIHGSHFSLLIQPLNFIVVRGCEILHNSLLRAWGFSRVCLSIDREGGATLAIATAKGGGGRNCLEPKSENGTPPPSSPPLQLQPQRDAIIILANFSIDCKFLTLILKLYYDFVSFVQ